MKKHAFSQNITLPKNYLNSTLSNLEVTSWPLAFSIWVLLTSRPIQAPSLNEKPCLFPEYNSSSIKLPEFNILKLGGHQLTFGLLNLVLLTSRPIQSPSLNEKHAFSQNIEPFSKNYLNSTFLNVEVTSWPLASSIWVLLTSRPTTFSKEEAKTRLLWPSS